MTRRRQAESLFFGARDNALALGLALTPLITLNACYALAASLDHVPLCVPYVEGCTSTSSTGRALPERLIFLPGMLTTALLSAVFWRRCTGYLLALNPAIRWVTSLRWLGLFAALSLAIYTLSIGQTHETYRVARRAGVSGFFLANYAAQIVFFVACRRETAASRNGVRWLGALCAALPAAAIGSETAKWLGLEKHAVNNVVEWNGIVLVCAYYAFVGIYFFSRSGGRPASPRE